MSQSEHNIQNQIRLDLSGPLVKLFRQNVGTGWTGQVTRLADGSIHIRNPRVLHAGLVKGSGDLIGWRKVTVTPEMVGQEIAVFASVEVKAARGRPTKEQLNWQRAVLKDGGFAVIAKNSEEAKLGLALGVKDFYTPPQDAR